MPAKQGLHCRAASAPPVRRWQAPLPQRACSLAWLFAPFQFKLPWPQTPSRHSCHRNGLGLPYTDRRPKKMANLSSKFSLSCKSVPRQPLRVGPRRGDSLPESVASTLYALYAPGAEPPAAAQSPRIWPIERLGVMASGSSRQCRMTGKRVSAASARRRCKAGANCAVFSTRSPWPPNALA